MTVFVSCEPPAALKPTGHTMYKSLVSDYVLGCVHIWCPSTSLVSGHQDNIVVLRVYSLHVNSSTGFVPFFRNKFPGLRLIFQEL